MKYLFAVIPTLLLLFTSCEKEINNPVKPSETSNTLSIDNNVTALTQAIVKNDGPYNQQDQAYEGYLMYVGLYSSEVELITEEGVITDFGGIGDGVEFEFFATNPQLINNQEFELTNTYKENTFSFAIVYSDFDFTVNGMIDGTPIADGNLTLSLSQNLLTLKSMLILYPSNDTVYVQYTGAYQYKEAEL